MLTARLPRPASCLKADFVNINVQNIKRQNKLNDGTLKISPWAYVLWWVNISTFFFLYNCIERTDNSNLSTGVTVSK